MFNISMDEIVMEVENNLDEHVNTRLLHGMREEEKEETSKTE